MRQVRAATSGHSCPRPTLLLAALTSCLWLTLAAPAARSASWQPVVGPLDPPPVGQHDAIYDPVRHRMLVIAGFPRAALWELPLDGSTEWRYVPCDATPMESRTSGSVIYDPLRDRLVIFGGVTGSSVPAPNDVWAIDLDGTPTWSRLLPADPAAPVRASHTAIYDPIGDRMIVFGGVASAGGPVADVWALALSGTPAWTPLAPAGPGPTARQWHAGIHDPAGRRMIVYGGLSWTATETVVLGDAWALALDGPLAWSEIAAPDGPVGRFSAVAVFDPGRQRMIVHGGMQTVFGSTAGDAWALDLGGAPAWSLLSPSGTWPVRAEHAAVFDAIADAMVCEGGVGAPPGRVPNESLSLAEVPAWTSIAAPEPAPFPGRRYDATAFLDAARGRLLVFGGVREGTGYSNEIWCWSFTGAPGWSLVTASGSAPTSLPGTPFVYDPAHDRLLFVSGDPRWYRSGRLDRVHAFNLATASWSSLAASGGAPPGRVDHSVVLDPGRDRLIVYGGRHYQSPSDNTGYSDGDAWALSLATLAWSSILPSGTLPPTRGHHQAFLDTARDRMVVFGGNFYSQSLIVDPRRDAWTLSLGDAPAWTPLGPDAPDDGVAVLDAAADRLLVVSRHDMGTAAFPLAGGGWQTLATPGARPGPRETPAVAWDAAARRVYAFGGLARGLGSSGYAYRGDLWALDPGPAGTVAVGPGAPRRADLSLAGVRPTPSTGPFAVAFALADASPARLELLDVAGRRLASREVGALGAGPHVVPLAEGRALAPGVYLVRLTQGGHSRIARACVLR